MKIYFVRHGETNFNVELRQQFPETPLNSLGKRQAKTIAKRFKNIPLDCIIASTYARTMSTAHEIEKETSTPLTKSELFIERVFPTSVRGKLINDPEVTRVRTLILENWHDPNWHYEDEENFPDLMRRAEEALQFIVSRNKQNVAVVTHGYFLSILMFYILFGNKGDYPMFQLFFDRTTYTNTGLTVCLYENEEWKLLTLNDIVHLGE